MNVNIQPFVLLLYTTGTGSYMIFITHLLYITRRHAAVSTIQLRLTVNDLEFSAYLQAGRAKVQLKSEK